MISPADGVPTPRQLLLRILASGFDSHLEASRATRACALFGHSQNNTRVALNRLQSAGLIESVGRGIYRLGAPGRALAAEITAWRDAESLLRDWSGGWVVVVTGALARSDRKALRARERALALLGLCELDSGLFVRPDNFAGGVAFVRQRLQALGLESHVPVFLASEFDAGREERARGLWADAQLEAGYAEGQRRLEASSQRLASLCVEEAAREAYCLGDQAIRRLVFDPLLPAPLVNPVARQAFRETMRRYDEAGRRIWQRYLDSGAEPSGLATAP